MTQKSVSDLIFDKFTESLIRDDLFNGISAVLDAFVRVEKHGKIELQNILKNKQNENSKSGN